MFEELYGQELIIVYTIFNFPIYHFIKIKCPSCFKAIWEKGYIWLYCDVVVSLDSVSWNVIRTSKLKGEQTNKNKEQIVVTVVLVLEDSDSDELSSSSCD